MKKYQQSIAANDPSLRGRIWLFLIMLVFCPTSFAVSCADFSQLKMTESTPSTMTSRTQAQLEKYQAREELADQIFQAYFSQQLPQGLILDCAPSAEEREALLSVVSRIFLERSLEQLKAAKLPALKELMSALERQVEKTGVALFRAIPHLPNQDSEEKDRIAGVFRGSNSLFMNFEKIPSGDWIFLLVHELAHYLDPVLHEASVTWNSRTTAQALFALGAQHASLDTLSAQERTLLREYVRAGLERGLLAEVRAWRLGLSVYEAGQRKNLWGRIAWMDELLLLKPPRQSRDAFIFSYLDKTFSDPAMTGIFSLRIVQQEYFLQRQALRKTN